MKVSFLLTAALADIGAYAVCIIIDGYDALLLNLRFLTMLCPNFIILLVSWL